MVLTRTGTLILGMILGAALWILGDTIGCRLASEPGDDDDEPGAAARETGRAITDAVGDLISWARAHESR